MDDFKGIGGLRLAAAPKPIPQPDEVILQVHYAGLNPADAYLAEKQYPAKPRLPHILGRDGMGTVVEVGIPMRSAPPWTLSETLWGSIFISSARWKVSPVGP